MRPKRLLQPGWRSARSYIEQPMRPLVASAAYAPASPPFFTGAADSAWPPWRGLQLSLSYVAFLVYCAIVVTYAFGGAAPVVGVGLLGLLLERGRLTLPSFVITFALLCLVGVVGIWSTKWPELVKLEVGYYFRFLVVMIVGANVLSTKSRVRFFIFFLLGCYAFFPIRGGYFNYFLYNNTIYGRTYWTGVFGNPNDLFALLFFPLGLCAYVLITEQHRIARLIAASGIVLIAGDMLITKSRGGLLGLGLAIAVWFISRRRRVREYVLVGLTAAVLAVMAPEDVWKRMSNLFAAAEAGQLMAADDQGSADQRLELWKVGARIFKENPLIGVGIGAYSATHREYSRRGEFRSTAYGARDAHSTFISVAAEAGAIGLLLLLATIALAFRACDKTRKRLKTIDPRRSEGLLMVELALLGFLVACIFGSYGNVVLTYWHLLCLWALGRVYDPAVASGARRAFRSR